MISGSTLLNSLVAQRVTRLEALLILEEGRNRLRFAELYKDRSLPDDYDGSSIWRWRSAPRCSASRINFDNRFVLCAEYLKYAPCFRAMLTEGGSCHVAYNHLMAVTVAMDPALRAPQHSGSVNGDTNHVVDHHAIADVCW